MRVAICPGQDKFWVEIAPPIRWKFSGRREWEVRQKLRENVGEEKGICGGGFRAGERRICGLGR